MSLADLGPQYVPDPAGYADLQDRGGVGAWYGERYTHNFVQIQGPALSDLVLVLTFIDVFTWLVANVTGYGTNAFRFLRDQTTFLGSHSSEDDALQEFAVRVGRPSVPGPDGPTSTSTTTPISKAWAIPACGESPHSFRDRCSGAMTSTGSGRTRLRNMLTPRCRKLGRKSWTG